MRLLGITIGSRWNEDSHRRQAAARFGDIVAIEPGRSDHVTLTMKSGARIEIDGGSNDVGADIVVWDLERGETTLDWDDVERVELLPTPADLTVDAYRLFGTAKTAAGTFRGHVLWDSDECFSNDTLDGEDSDGRDVELPMGEIATIERRSRSSSRVILHDGREMILDGTNDVDDSIRGILIEDPRYGRVGISWDAFERLDFELAEDAGPPYQTFEPAERLTGTVTTTDGTRHRGQVIYDLDESETWEMLDAKRDGVEYSIPFSLIRVIEPRGDNASRIRLIGGEELELEGTADVNEDNAGILVITEGGAKRYVPWREVAKVELGL